MSKAFRRWKDTTYDALKFLHFPEISCNDYKRTMSGYKKYKKYVSSYRKRFKKIRKILIYLIPLLKSKKINIEDN